MMSQEKPKNQVKSHAFFDDLLEEDISEIQAELIPLVFYKGDVVFNDGDESDGLYLVINGVLVVTSGADQDVVLGEIHNNEIVGEIQALSGGKRTARVIASTDADILKIPKNAFDTLLERHPSLLTNINQIIHTRINRNQLIKILHSYFDINNEQTISCMEDIVIWRHVQQGEKLISQGDFIKGIYIVVNGLFRAIINNDDGTSEHVSDITRGETIGEISLLTEQAAVTDVYATRESDVVFISEASLDKVNKIDHSFIRHVTKKIVDRLQKKPGAINQQKSTNIVIVPIGKDVPIGEFTVRLTDALSRLSESLHIDSSSLDAKLGIDNISQAELSGPYNLLLSNWLHEQEITHPFIVYQADTTTSNWTKRAIDMSDHIILVGWASGDPGQSIIEGRLIQENQLYRELEHSLVLLHANGNQLPSGTREWLAARNINTHHHVRWDRSNDIHRVARFISGNAVCLVLGGGGARGYAHSGVIRALNEAGIPIDIVGGTSAGAGLAVGPAMNWSPEFLNRESSSAFLKLKPFKEYGFPVSSLVKGKKYDAAYKKIIGDIRIEDFWLNYFCVSCDLSNAEEVVHRDGPAWKAIRASGALPVIFPPVIDNHHLLIDGAVLANLPVKQMTDICNGHIIACSVSPMEDLITEFDNELPSGWDVLFSRLWPFKKSLNAPGIIDILMRTLVINSIKQQKNDIQEVVLMLCPPMENYGITSFKSADKMAEVGYEYTKEVIRDLPDEILEKIQYN